MHEPSLNSVEVRFLDLEAVLRDLRSAVAEARASHPEIAKVFLFGSLTRGNWTADSDADLIVVVRREFPDLLDRGRYHITSRLVPTDTLVYSEAEFAKLANDPSSFVAESLTGAIEL